MRKSALACAFALALIAPVWAQTSTTVVMDQRGQIVSIDPSANVIVLDNGQMYRVTPNTTVYVDNQPMTLSTLRPGQGVVIRSGEAVAFQNGQYVIVGQAQPNPPAPNVVITPPAPAPAGFRQTVYGKVKDVDRDGVVKIETERDSFRVRVARDRGINRPCRRLGPTSTGTSRSSTTSTWGASPTTCPSTSPTPAAPGPQSSRSAPARDV